MFITERRACGTKTQYETREDADDTLGFLAREKGVRRNSMNVYRCKYCDWFHIGHKQPIRRGVKSSWSTA